MAVVGCSDHLGGMRSCHAACIKADLVSLPRAEHKRASHDTALRKRPSSLSREVQTFCGQPFFWSLSFHKGLSLSIHTQKRDHHRFSHSAQPAPLNEKARCLFPNRKGHEAAKKAQQSWQSEFRGCVFMRIIGWRRGMAHWIWSRWSLEA